MNRKRIIGWSRDFLAVFIVFLFIGGGIKWLFSYGSQPPPDAMTGAPFESTCMSCHTSAPVTNPSSDISLDVPSSYVPNQAYDLTLSIANDAAGNNGFEVTAKPLDNTNNYAAAWSNAGSLSTISTNWWKHSSGSSQTSWTVKWTAPAANTGTVRFYVIVNKGFSSPSGNFHQKTFDVIEGPSISSLSPSFGSLNTQVTIAGAKFTTTVSTVNFQNGIATAPVTSWANTSIVVKATGSASGNVTVTNANGTSNGKAFTLLTAAPSISSTTPTFGNRDAPNVTISVSGFSLSPQASVVLSTDTAGVPVSSAAATGITVSTSTQISNATLNLSGMVTGYWTITVTNPDGQSGTLTNGFLVQVKPPAPINLQATALSSAAIRWGWDIVGDTMDGFRLVTSTGGIVSPDLPVGTTTYDEYGYAPNASAVRAIEAFDVVGSSASATLSTATFANAPVAAASTFSPISITSFTANWGSNGNVSGTQYDAVASTETPLALMDLGNVQVSTSPSGAPSAIFAGLGPNTSYYLFVRAVNRNGAPTSYTELGSTATLANAPVSSSATVSVSSIVFSWSANGNPAGTTYFIQLSTDSSFNTLNLTGNILDTSALADSLASNTTFFFRVRAVNHNSVPTAFLTFSSTPTLPASPLALEATNIGTSSITANWGTNGNSAGTRYTAQISTNNFQTVNTSSQTLNAFAAFSGLLANTTYNFRVQARGHGGQATDFVALPSTRTLLAPPALSGQTFASVGTSSIAVQWASGGNGPGTTYVAQLSTDGFVSVNLSSSTLNLSVTFGSGGEGPALVPNTTYYFHVQSTNDSNSSSFVNLGSTLTFAAAPQNPTLAEVDQSSITLGWEANGNPSGTSYAAQISTAANGSFTTLNASSQTLNAFATFASLIPNTTYFLRVKAVGFNGRSTGFAVAPATPTYAAAPTASAPSGIGVSSLTANWGAANNPAGTVYIARISTDGFVTVNASSRTLNSFAGFSGLLPNTTYDLEVQALGNNGVLTAQTVLASTSTLANPPSAPALAEVGLSSISLSWGLNSNPDGTIYQAHISTAAGFATLNDSSQTLNAFAIFSSLVPNTTYFLRVRAVNNNGIPTAFVSPPSTPTYAAAPAAEATDIVGVSSLTANWGANGNAGGTAYVAQVSTDGLATVNASSRTLNLSATFAGLKANTTYFLGVRALGHNGVFTAQTPLPAASTPPNPPASVALGAVNLTSVTLTWSVNANGPATVYTAQISSDNITINDSSQTLNAFAVFAGLVSNSTYFLRVRTEGNAGPTAFVTAPAVPTLAALPLAAQPTGVTADGITANWDPNGNSPTTVYTARISTNNFTTVNASSQTLNAFAVFAGLVSNSTYFLRVRTEGNAGPTAFVTAPAVPTLAALPLAAQPTGVTAAGLTANWDPNGNSPTTVYTARISTNNFTTVNASSQTLNAFAVFSGLASNTTYFLQVRARGHNGQLTDFAALPSTKTLLASPGPAAQAFGPVGVSSITAKWASGGNAVGTAYLAQISTDGFASVNASSATRNLSVRFGTGGAGPPLSPNTTYYFHVQSTNDSNSSSFVDLGSTPTLAVPPANPAAAGVDLTAAAFQWSANGNPAGTLYRAQISTNNFATVNASSRTLDTMASFPGLSSNATCFLRVQAISHGGFATAFAAAAATATLVATPTAADPTGVAASSLTIHWGANGNFATTVYTAQISTNNFVTVNRSSQTKNVFAGFSGLLANTDYFFRVRARGHNGQLTEFVALPSTTTLLLPPGLAAVKFPKVGISSVTVQWTAGGNPPGTTYRARISTDNFATVNLDSSTLNLSATFGTGGEGPDLDPNTIYFFKVQSTNGANASAFTSLGSILTLAALPLNPDFLEVNRSSISFNWGPNGNPPGTRYTAQISLNNFAAILASSQTLNAQATFKSLIANTTYFLRVRAINNNGALSPFVALPATPTYAAAPAALATSGISVSSLTANWGANGNPAKTRYLAQISTDGFVSVNASTLTARTSATFGGLEPNTTYFLQVHALGHNGAAGADIPLGSTSTLAKVPLNAVLAEVDLASVTFNWGANGNPAGTVYAAQISTNNFTTLNASSRTLNLSVVFPDLISNATYFLRVRAVNNNGLPTVFAVVPATPTLVATPAAADPTNVTASSLTVHWGANGNSPTTVYTAQISTDDFTTVNRSSQTKNVFAGFPGLLANKEYFFRVRARGHNGQLTEFTALPSTTTFLLAPAPAAVKFPRVGVSSVTVQWASGSNGPETVYIARISTDNFVTVNLDSSTLNLSAAFGTGGEGPDLIPNTTYFFKVRSTNGTDLSAFISLGSTSTLAAVPANPAFAEVNRSSITLSWEVNGNPPATRYLAQISVNNFTTVAASSQTLNIQATFAGLIPNSTYFLRVRAINRNNIPTAFAPTLSTHTLAAPPTALAATTVGISSLTANWGANGNPATTRYMAKISTDGFITVNASTVTPKTAFAFLGLGPNTTYFLLAQALDTAGGVGAQTGLNPVATLAKPPSGAALVEVDLSSMAFQWSVNGNPDGTLYRAQISTNNFTTLNASSRTLNTAASFPGLLSNATYFLRVQAINHGGFLSAFAVIPATATLVATPTAADPTNINASSLTAHWGANGNSLTTVYTAQISTDNFATVNRSSQTRNVFASFSGLLADTGYFFRVRVRGHNGQFTDFVALPSTTTLLLPPGPAAVKFPKVGISSVTVQWASGGNAAGTTYLAQISTDNFASVNASSATQNLTATFGQGGEGGDLIPNTTYHFRVQTNNGANTSVFAGLGPISTLAVPPLSPAFVLVKVSSITFGWDPGANPAATRYTAQISVNNFATVSASSQTLNQFAVFLGLTANTTYFLRVRASNNNGIATAFTAAISTKTLMIGQSALSAAASAAEAPGRPAALVPAAMTLGDARAYPVPFKPNGGNPDEGKPFSPGDPLSGIIFDQLPPTASIRIYTLTGRLVAELSSLGGKVQWDARNSDGRDAASGGYLAVISASGERSVVKKLVIIR